MCSKNMVKSLLIVSGLLMTQQIRAGDNVQYRELDTVMQYAIETRNSGFSEMYKRLPKHEQMAIAHSLKKIKHELNEIRVKTLDWHNDQDKALQLIIKNNRISVEY